MRAHARRLLGAAIGVLALVLVLEWLWPAGDAAGPVFLPAHGARPHPATPAAVRETSGWGATVLERPVFSISRRPPRVAARSAGQAVAGQARLSGIMIGHAGRRAIFAPEGGGKPLVLAEGATINDSTIRRIQPDRVILASGQVMLPAYDKSGRGSAITPPLVPAFQPGFPNQGFPNPAFPNPAFPNQGFPNPGFPNPGFPNPGFTPQGIQPPPPPGVDDVPTPGMPTSRNPMIPQRRE